MMNVYWWLNVQSYTSAIRSGNNPPMMNPPVCIIAVQAFVSSAVSVSSSGKSNAAGNNPPNGIAMMNAPIHISGWIPVQKRVIEVIPAISINNIQNFLDRNRSISNGMMILNKICTVVIILRRVPACNNVIPTDVAMGATHVTIEKKADD